MTSNQPPPAAYVYGMPEPNQSCQSPHSTYLTKIKRTAILQLIGGCLLVVFGIVAIILMARWSYFATAIWSGIVVFGTTGVIGISAASNGYKCLVRTYMALSIVGCVMGFALFEMHIFAAILELQRYSYNDWYSYCQPGKYWSVIPNCAKSVAARQTFDALICITGFFLFILCIVSASFGCCASCRGCGPCCRKCCRDGGICSDCCSAPTPQITAVFQPQGNAFTTTPGHQQAGLYIVQQGPPPVIQQGPPTVIQYPNVVLQPPPTTNQGQGFYVVPPPTSGAPPPTNPMPNQMDPQQPNPAGPPTYVYSQPITPVEYPAKA
nr:uncharacterized protein LOC129263454 [Lytechinus pictus]